ncbi:hypothetical protein ACFXHA_05680 [Nocardia sp. NPDC059240]|uniref:hypothetical protein n=1 Tax=Nocardia sp. NPDC059240 TaxID=3346786 RepID=UPI0036D02405
MSLDVYEDIERCFEAGWSDGLPVIPPYGTLVDTMLEACGWSATEVVGTIEDQHLEIRGEHLAAAAVMAGCKPEYGRFLRAVGHALLDPLLNISGCEVTTGGVSTTVIASGSIVGELGFEHEANALGANNRVNATIGRFAQLVRLFCGRAGGVLQAHGTIGHPGRLSFCIAEHPVTFWPSFHTQFALAAEASAATIMATEGPISVNNHYAESGEQILLTIADTIAHFGSTAHYYQSSGYLIAIAPDHMELVQSQFTRDEARRFLFEHATRQTDDLARVGRIPLHPAEYWQVVPGEMRAPFRTEEQLSFVECGKEGGKFSAVIPRWTGNVHVISRPVAESK